MKEILDILSGFRTRGVELSLDNSGRSLKARGNVKSLSDPDRQVLAERKGEIILLLKQSRQAAIHIEPLPHSEHYTLSSSQRRLWMLSQFEEAAAAYNIPLSFLLQGEVNEQIFARAFHSLIARHESLRTIFPEDSKGEPGQVILEPERSGFHLSLFDLRESSDADGEVRKLIAQQDAQAFNLRTGPLMRAALVRMEEKKWVLHCVLHHIISDGWSMHILVQELMRLYDAYSRGAESPLPSLRIQYKDYAAWQQEQLNSEQFCEDKAYWLRQFEGGLPVLELPTDHARPAVKTYNGAVVERHLPFEVGNALASLSQQQGGTLFIGLLAAVKALLYRYSGQTDIITGTPIAGREHAELEEQIGFFLNTLALRTRFSPEASFLELLEQVKEVTLGAFAHQRYPLDELVESLELRRDSSRNPLFDVMVVLQNTGLHTAEQQQEAGGLKVSVFKEADAQVSKFDLSFVFVEAKKGLQLSIEYNTDIYNKSTIERMAAHLENLLQAIIRAPAAPLHELDLLAAEEKQLLLSAFNNNSADYPRHKTIVTLFEEQVQKTPDATALVFEKGSLTYRQLNEQANQLAHYLKNMYSIQPGELVAICLQRSFELVTSILAIIKAGGAYVPVDPLYPQERIDYMLEDSRSKLLINEAEMDIFRQQQEQYSTENLTPYSLTPSALAYVIYTSGSTGKPKGVMVQHRALVNLCFWHNSSCDVQAEDRATLYAGVAFDAAVLELFPYLIRGASLYIVPEDIRLDIDRLAEYYEANHITIAFLPTLLGEQFAAGGAEPSSLRYLLVGGQKLNSFTERKYAIIDEYGPTENTVVSTSCIVTHQTRNIGKPISNTQVYILDDHMNLQPLGVPGEICIGGEGLALGYWNRPELTAANFVANPFKRGERMYRTGDLGRWLEDGSIEFLGRRDEQVKVRGYRIELGEIEAALQSHSSVSSCVVLAKAAQQGENELVAYLSAEETLSAGELRAWLGRKLPGYMVPSHYVQVEALPLTPNGKVDKKQLPAPEGLALSTGSVYMAPRNSTEEKLVAIWEQILGRNKIGVSDNFFELGGSSLKIIRMVEAVNTAFGKSLPVITGFRYPKIDRLAELLLSEEQAVQHGKSEEDFDIAVNTIEDTLLIINQAGYED
jgi:amino acid adenylation domain-containing protein